MSMSVLQQKISQAKAKLLVDYPFFGAIASRLELVPNDNIKAFKSNGVVLEYSKEFLARLSYGEMEFVFANGAMHASLSHEGRKSRRNSWLWQLATDYAINDMLVENGLSRPDEAHYSKRFTGLYAEEIYEQLKEDIFRDELEDGDDKDDEQNHDIDEQKNKTQQESQSDILKEQLFKEETMALLESEIKKGDIPKSIGRFFISHNSKIDWRNELKTALDKFHKNDFTLIPPNKKLLYLGLYLPSYIGQKFKLAIAIDSSGSIDEKLLGEFLSEVNFIMNTISDYQIELFVCDDKIHSHTTFYSGDILETHLVGGGATDFRAVFEFVEKEFDDIKLLLYFTDLDGIFPDEEPNYQVKWITTKEKKVPFGDILIIN